MFRTILVALALVGCNGVTMPSVPPAVDAGPPMGDAAPDAWTGTDGGPLEGDAGGELGDSGLEPDAAPELTDAGSDAGSDAGPVSQLEACARVADAYAATGCDPAFSWCAYTAPASTSSVEACESSIAAAYADLSGDGTIATRCRRAIAAMNACAS